MPHSLRQLRHIAVHVEEPSRGRYVWVLTERDDGGWREFARCMAPAATYKRAMADGLLTLQAMVEDLDVGPRVIREGEAAENARVRAEPAAQDADADGRIPTTRRYFGFGPAR
jgi:hypothetical protein